MGGNGQEQKAKEMDEALLGLRLARRGNGEVKGWLREVRQTVGIPVNEVARRLGVCRWQVYRHEQSEMESKIMLSTLRKAAEGLDCELVYGLVPREGTLMEMAARQMAVHDKALAERRQEAREKKEAERKPWLEEIGWNEALMNGLRVALQRQGVRVRPRKTEAGMAAKEEKLKMVAELAGRKGDRD